MGSLRYILAVIALVTICYQALYASDSSKARPCGCFYERPAPRCCGYVVLEAGLRFRVGETRHEKDSETFLASFDFGYMVNRDSTWSYGGTLYWSADDEGTRIAVRPRIRLWVAHDRAFDLSLGLIVNASDDYVATKMPGFAGTLSYGRANAFSVGVTYEAFRVAGAYVGPYNFTLEEDSGWRTGWYVGAMLKNWAALVGFMVFAMITKDF